VLRRIADIIWLICRDGGIGRRARLRTVCRKACRFKSCSRHQLPAQSRGYPARPRRASSHCQGKRELISCRNVCQPPRQIDNDYVELLVQMGTLGFVAMLWFIVAVYQCAAKKIGKWAHDVNGPLSLAVILGVAGILVHSLFDFNFKFLPTPRCFMSCVPCPQCSLASGLSETGIHARCPALPEERSAYH
jgi:hypothetical protein